MIWTQFYYELSKLRYLISSVIAFFFFLFLCSSFTFPYVCFIFQSFCSCFILFTLLFPPLYILISVPFPYLFIRRSSLFLPLRTYPFLYISYFSTHPIFFLPFPSLFRISSNISFFFPSFFYFFLSLFRSLCTYHNQIYLSCCTTKASRYWLFKPANRYLHKKLHLRNGTSYEDNTGWNS